MTVFQIVLKAYPIAGSTYTLNVHICTKYYWK